MKRKNLIVDETLLEEARTLTGIRTYSETVNRALAEMIRAIEVEKLLALEGKDLLKKRKNIARKNEKSDKKGKRKE